ncbi:MAG: hypothetical protein MEFUS_02866 [Fusobacterium varium]
MNKILIITEGTKPDKKIVEHLIKTYSRQMLNMKSKHIIQMFICFIKK